MKRNERQWAQYEASAIHEYGVLQERFNELEQEYDDEVEGRQRDRHRCRWAIGKAKVYRLAVELAKGQKELIAELQERLEEAMEVLRDVEWIMKCDDCNLEGFEAFCGKCGAWKKDGHDGSCTVAALRGGEEGR